MFFFFFFPVLLPHFSKSGTRLKQMSAVGTESFKVAFLSQGYSMTTRRPGIGGNSNMMSQGQSEAHQQAAMLDICSIGRSRPAERKKTGLASRKMCSSSIGQKLRKSQGVASRQTKQTQKDLLARCAGRLSDAL